MKWTWFRPPVGFDYLLLLVAFIAQLETPYFFTPLRQGIVIGLWIAWFVMMLRTRTVMLVACAALGFVSATMLAGRAPHGFGFWLTQFMVAGFAALGILGLVRQVRARQEPVPSTPA